MHPDNPFRRASLQFEVRGDSVTIVDVVENAAFTTDYLDPAKRSIGNAVTVHFRDGTKTERVAVEYPIGHRRRRNEGVPLVLPLLRVLRRCPRGDDRGA